MTQKLSTQITNLNALPPILEVTGKLAGRYRINSGTLEALVADLAAADTIVLGRLPTNARVYQIFIFSDDLGGTLTVDVGLFNTDGTVKDADAYASAIDLAAAAVTDPPNVAFEARNIDVLGQRVWEDAGDSEDPGNHYDVGLTVAASTTPAAGTISWVILYAID